MEFKENNYEKLVEVFRDLGESKEYYADFFYANDYPVPYKSLILHPVQIDLYAPFYMFLECLMLPHLTSGDPNAISKSYLEYLIYLANEKGQQKYLLFLFQLLSISLKIPVKTNDNKLNFDIVKDGNKFLLRIEDNVYDSKDFDVIREIICEQNGFELPDEETNPEILQAAKEADDLRRKMSKIKMCDLEDQINIVVASSSCTRKDCLQMTIRSFNRLFERIDKIMHYELFTLLSPDLTDAAKKEIKYYAEAHKTYKERLQDMRQDAEVVEKNFTTGMAN